MYLLDIINIARCCHVPVRGILIKAALIILSIWILVDKSEYPILYVLKLYLCHSDLILVSPAIKTCQVLVDTACLIIWEWSTFFSFFPQINTVQRWRTKQAGICFRCEFEEVLRLRNSVIRPPLELGEALEAPGQREKHKEISLGTMLFLHCCPITMSCIRNPSSHV